MSDNPAPSCPGLGTLALTAPPSSSTFQQLYFTDKEITTLNRKIVKRVKDHKMTNVFMTKKKKK
jgi:hypothetical protein